MDRHEHYDDYERPRYDNNYRNPEVVAAFKQKGTNHPITVIQYKDAENSPWWGIMWNNKKFRHDPFTSKDAAVEYIKANAKVEIWTAAYRPLAV
jgi:hypothetical protein